MRIFKRVVALVLLACMVIPMVPLSAFAAYDSTGRPLDLKNQLYLAIYLGTDDFPGEPANHATSGYNCLNSNFSLGNSSSVFATTAEEILEPSILDDVVEGSDRVWGVFSTSGGSRYLKSSSGLVTGEDGQVNKPHNETTEQKIIQNLVDGGKITLAQGKTAEDYTIVWYVIKFQPSDSAWHIDGKVIEKASYSVNYYGNGNTSGGAPTGTSGLHTNDRYTVLGNTGNLQKKIGRDTYLFKGWNTNTDGTGTHYNAGDTIVINDSNVTLYAEWYLQNRYSASVIIKLDEVERNIEEVHSGAAGVYLLKEGSTEYIELEKTSAGTYTTEVTENGTYMVYFRHADGEFEQAHGHSVIIYNQNARTEFLNYTVNYELGEDGYWAEGEDPGVKVYHANSQVIATENIPHRPGYTFLGWVDQNENAVNPGHQVTDKILERTVLTAQWEKNVNVTVNITVNHKKGDQLNAESGKDEVLFQLLQNLGNVNQPYGEKLYLNWENNDWYQKNESTDEVTKYSYTIQDLPKGIYTATANKSHYKLESITHEGTKDTDQTINIVLQYEPGTFDLDFCVKAKPVEVQGQELMPKAVNVKVLVWDATLESWRLIDQHAGDSAPVTVYLDDAGNGSGFVPVWQYMPHDSENLAVYRVIATSFVMPNGHVVHAESTDMVNFKSDPAVSGLYSAVSTVEDGDPSVVQGGLNGATFNKNTDNEQTGIPTITVDIHPYKVTFVAKSDAVDGKVNGKSTLELQNRYLYPNLRSYIADSNDPNYVFAYWADAEGKPVTNLYGEFLKENVTYYAVYSPPMTVRGDILVKTTYTQNGELIQIKENDLVKRVIVVLQRVINDNLVDMDSRIAEITYSEKGADGIGEYIFENIPNDGADYRISVLANNYHTSYDNEADEDEDYTPNEYAVVLGDDNEAVIDVLLDMQPELYTQLLEVDASQISESFRPYGVLAEILYRDLGDIHHYDVIAQHELPPYGIQVPLSVQGYGNGGYDVWRYHTDGSRYEYQMNVTKVYGEVDGVFAADGTVYDSDNAPYTINYGPATHYSALAGGQSATLKATLVPNTYEIRFEMGLEENEQVQGMDQFITDDGAQGEYYSYAHTWSREDQFYAYPYRAGYVFEGWISEHDGVRVENGGHIIVGAGLAENVVLTAKWRALEGTAYVVRHLEMYTEKPLAGAVVQENAIVGSKVSADSVKATIAGYKYYGASVDGTFYREAEKPSMTVTNDNTKNVMVLYYVTDGSDGYTEQVESNLKLDKTAALVDNGTYTINLETYTLDNPVTTQILNNTPLDVVLVIDQSGSIIKSGYLDELQSAVDSFIATLAYHGRQNEVDHRIAIVGYAGDYDEPPTSTDTNQYPIAGGNTTNWVNTGVFDSNGDFHPYPITGFYYSEFTGKPEADGTYYTFSEGEYLLMTHHDAYYHLINETEAKNEVAHGDTVYGYVYDDAGKGHFKPLERNTSGLWLYEDKQLYSSKEFFTFHRDVWTHRKDLDARKIHAYGTGESYTCTDGHGALFVRQETTDANPELSVYHDALTPVSLENKGAGGINYHLENAAHKLGSNGGTFVQYGIEMGNKVFEANPLEKGSDRVRVMVVFTDGMPGIGTFDENVANEAIQEAYITKNTHDAHVYTLGLYNSASVTEDQTLFMNAVSSNYPTVLKLADLQTYTDYELVPDGTALQSNGGPYYAKSGNNFYKMSYSNSWMRRGWTFDNGSWWNNTVTVSSSANPVVTNGKIGSYEIYYQVTKTAAEKVSSDYYSTTENIDEVEDYFNKVLYDITTKIRREIILHSDTIMRDIMGQGMVLTPGTTVVAYRVPGHYENGEIVWGDRKELASVEIPLEGIVEDTMYSEEKADISYTAEDGTQVTKQVPYISLYNLTAENPTDPDAPNYHPHAVEITGYDFADWYIQEDHPGYKMEVEITRVEARDNVEWGRSTNTNHEMSGLWLPKDAQENRELLRPFPQPKTIFVERAYVLDYGKEFKLSGWYFDDDVAAGKEAKPIHIDCNVEDGMNWFNTEEPTKSNSKLGEGGNQSVAYGNIHIDGRELHYVPTSMNWHGFDQFYVFGETWRKTVLAQDANNNGIPQDPQKASLWNKVTVIPANNIYYEDSFITKENTDSNSIQGWTFSENWVTVNGDGAHENQETPEHLESAPYGDVHGWTDSLRDDQKFTDNSYHMIDKLSSIGSTAEFTFTGTGVEVYTRTNANSGMVVAILKQHVVEENAEGVEEEKIVTIRTVAIDNLAVSGDYYHIPTVSFDKLEYGTYTLQIIATAASGLVNGELDNSVGAPKRYEYYIDGVRIYNPLGYTTNYAPEIVKDAYGLETNAVFTEVRDILLDYKDFNVDMSDGTDGKLGAAFIDWIQPDQGIGNDPLGSGVPTYEIGTFKTYGPKNEVYLTSGQAIVLKVDPANHYYIGLKSLTGSAVAANVSGIDRVDPTMINIDHTTDLYYQVTPVDGYIVIQNGSTAVKDEIGPILSVTNLRTTHLKDPAPNGGVLELTSEEAVMTMRSFSASMNRKQAAQRRMDINGDGNITNEDVVELVWYTLFAEENAISGDADLDRDGAVTNTDVIELLWYVLFPEQQNWEKFV